LSHELFRLGRASVQQLDAMLAGAGLSVLAIIVLAGVAIWRERRTRGKNKSLFKPGSTGPKKPKRPKKR
jgi:hypothetical protein